MLIEIYIEALLADEELADQVWEAWDAGEIGNLTSAVQTLELSKPNSC